MELSFQELRARQILQERGVYPLSVWRDARLELNSSESAARAADNRFNKDWYDEVLAVLHWADWAEMPDTLLLEIAPSKQPTWDFKLGASTIQVTIALPDWKAVRCGHALLGERPYEPGVQRARRNEKLARDGFVFGHGLIKPDLEYAEPPSARSREEGIDACKLGVQCALDNKAKRSAPAKALADVLLIYGAELNAFGPRAPIALFERTLEGTKPPLALSTYKRILVVSSAPGWASEWNGTEGRWKLISGRSDIDLSPDARSTIRNDEGGGLC
jgi:hypothetical protein